MGPVTEVHDARQRLTARLCWLLPGVRVQAALHRQVDIDLQAQLAYQDRIADLRARLRAYYYPYLFNEVRFGPRDFAAQPRFSPSARSAETPVGQMLRLVLMGVLALVLGAAATGRVRPM